MFTCGKKVLESNIFQPIIKVKNCANKYVGPTGLEIYLNEIFLVYFSSEYESLRYIVLRILKIQKGIKKKIKLLEIPQRSAF